MAQESGMVQRGLLLLGLMLILVTVLGFILFRPASVAPQVQAHIEKRAASNAAGWQRVQAALNKVATSENAVLREEAETLKQAIASR